MGAGYKNPTGPTFFQNIFSERLLLLSVLLLKWQVIEERLRIFAVRQSPDVSVPTLVGRLLNLIAFLCKYRLIKYNKGTLFVSKVTFVTPQSSKGLAESVYPSDIKCW
jgi:hypothetical protein